jgi:hypothetical protein
VDFDRTPWATWQPPAYWPAEAREQFTRAVESLDAGVEVHDHDREPLRFMVCRFVAHELRHARNKPRPRVLPLPD